MACRGPGARAAGVWSRSAGKVIGSRPRRVDRAGEDLGDRLAAGLAGIPRLRRSRLHVVAPRHRDRVAGLQHDDRVRVGGRDRLDDGVLSPRQRQVGIVEALALDADREHDGDVAARAPSAPPRPASCPDRTRSGPREAACASSARGDDGSRYRLRPGAHEPGTADSDDLRVPAGRHDRARPAPGRHADLGVAADHRDRSRSCRSAAAGCRRSSAARCPGARSRARSASCAAMSTSGGRTPSVDADGVHRAQDASHHLRQPLAGSRPRRAPGAAREGSASTSSRRSGPDSWSSPERELPAGCGAPVGHHPARVAPGALQHVLDEHARCRRRSRR